MSVFVKTNSGAEALSNVLDIVSLQATNKYNKCVKKYTDGRFEAFGMTTIIDLEFNKQIGSTNIYYAPYISLYIGIKDLKSVLSVIHTCRNSGVVWTGNASCGTNGVITGTILQYGNTSRSTDLSYFVTGYYK